MSAENQAGKERFITRVTELRSQRNLLLLRTQQLPTEPESEDEELEAFTTIQGICVDLGKAASDLSWAEGMVLLERTGNLSFEIALKIWDAKDQASRRAREAPNSTDIEEI